MDVTGIWIIKLPMDLQIFNDFYGTELTNFEFKVRDANCELIKETDRIVNKIKVSITIGLNENLYPYSGFDEYNKYYCDNDKMDKVIEFTDKMELEVASIVENLLDGFVRYASGLPHEIYDGHSFITEHTVEFSPQLFGNSHNNADIRDSRSLNNEELDKAIHYATKEKDYLDLSWKFLCEAEENIYMAKYEMAIINMGIMAEYLVTSKLSSILKEDGRFKKREHANKADKGFVDKYFRFGLPEINCPLPEEEILEAIKIIYLARNKIVHRKKNAVQSFEELDLDFEETKMSAIMRDLFLYSNKLHRYFEKLECK